MFITSDLFIDFVKCKYKASLPFADSEELVRNSSLPLESLIEVGTEHRLADEESLQAMERACERTTLVDVTVYYLEMLAAPQRSVPPPRDGLLVLPVQSPSVPYYRFLYDAVGEDYNWRSRRRV